MPNFRSTLASVGKLTDIHTSQKNALGQRVADEMGYEYIYLKGVASTAAGDWVFYNASTFATTRVPASTATNGFLAVAGAATLASQFGWYQIFGLTPTYTAVTSDAAADGKLLSASSGTIGRLLPGVGVSTKNIFGAVCVGASASNVGTVSICYPFEFGSATI